jgi:hypothetical protein
MDEASPSIEAPESEGHCSHEHWLRTSQIAGGTGGAQAGGRGGSAATDNKQAFG